MVLILLWLLGLPLGLILILYLLGVGHYQPEPHGESREWCRQHRPRCSHEVSPTHGDREAEGGEIQNYYATENQDSVESEPRGCEIQSAEPRGATRLRRAAAVSSCEP
jgi:hypothetical protein